MGKKTFGRAKRQLPKGAAIHQFMTPEEIRSQKLLESQIAEKEAGHNDDDLAPAHLFISQQAENITRRHLGRSKFIAYVSPDTESFIKDAARAKNMTPGQFLDLLVIYTINGRSNSVTGSEGRIEAPGK